MVQVSNYKASIEHISLCITRMLVRALFYLANINKEVALNFQNKLAGFVTRLHQYNLPPSKIYFGYKINWWVSIKHIAPALTLPV